MRDVPSSLTNDRHEPRRLRSLTGDDPSLMRNGSHEPPNDHSLVGNDSSLLGDARSLSANGRSLIDEGTNRALGTQNKPGAWVTLLF